MAMVVLAVAAVADTGRALYRGWLASSADARVGPGNLKVAAAKVPCVNCHGRDGAGGGERTLAAPAIDIESLSASTARRPGYTLDAFSRAVVDGIDSAGRRLNPLMPRYALGSDEVTAIFQYLRHLPLEQRIGVTSGSVRFAVLVPQGRKQTGETIRAAFLQAWQESGSFLVHGRAPELVVVEHDFEAEVLESKARHLNIFAVLLGVPDPNRRIFRDAATAGLPLLFPFAQPEGTESPLDVRAVFPSRRDELVHAGEALGGDGVIVADETGLERLRLLGLDRGRKIETVERLLAAPSIPPRVLVVGGTGVLRDLARADLRQTMILCSSPQPKNEVLHQLRVAGARVVAVVPFDPKIWSPAQLTVERHAAVAAAVLRSALAVAGRDLNRNRLAAAFDKVRYEGPLWPELDFTRHPLTGTRTVGLVGAAE